MMQKLPQALAQTLRRSSLAPCSKCLFSIQKSTKDREQAEERVYINQHEKQTLKKLLNKLEDQEENEVESGQQFSRRMKQILKRNRIDNVAFEAEVQNLHRVL